MTKRKWLLAASALTIMLLLAACGGNNAANKGNGDTTAAASAETIYKKNCVTCHGADLKGQNLNNVGSRMSKDEIATQISEGGGGMMAFKGRLSESDIDTLAVWLEAKK